MGLENAAASRQCQQEPRPYGPEPALVTHPKQTDLEERCEFYEDVPLSCSFAEFAINSQAQKRRMRNVCVDLTSAQLKQCTLRVAGPKVHCTWLQIPAHRMELPA
jgi:hypothetical protein